MNNKAVFERWRLLPRLVLGVGWGAVALPALALPMATPAVGRYACEGERESGVTERVAQRVPIEAQSAAVARATASICNEELRPLGGTSGHVRFPLTLCVAGGPAAAPPSRGEVGRVRRGVDLPAPPVRLPAGAQLGGAFEPGRYACLSTLRPGGGQPVSSTYDFHANGEWRRLNVREQETGYYVAVPQTGRFDAFNRAFGNPLDHPDDDYAVYFRGASGAALLLGRSTSGTVQRETRCERTGAVEGAAPAEVKRQAQQASDRARAQAAAAAQARGRRNLEPPPPGTTRWQGLYAKETFQQKQRIDPGPYGGFSRLVIDASSTWEFLDFQPNGYVRLGSRPPVAPCDRPAVKDNGEPLCTTYDVDRGRLRIGHDDRGTVSREGGGRRLQVAGKTFEAVPPLTPGRLAGTYQAASCHGALCEKTTWVFGADGRFGAYGLNQGFGTGAGPAGLPMPQGWAHTGKLEGRYRIDGQGLHLTDGNGQSAELAVFLYPPKDKVLSIGGREFLRKGKGA